MRTLKMILFSIGFLLVLLGSGRSIQHAQVQAAVQAAENTPAATNTIQLVVQFSQSDRLIRAVEFSQPTISGLQALLDSGLSVITRDYGGGLIAVCSIEGVGCPADDCFCDSSKFWNYEYWGGSAWQGHSTGAAGVTLSPGDIEGWRWGEFDGSPILPFPQLESAWRALQWLKGQQNTDGGFGTPNSAASSSVESLLAIASNHYKASEWKKTADSSSLLAHLMASAATYTAASASAAGKFAVGASAGEVCLPYQTKTPADFYDSSNGKYANGAGEQAWAMLGIAAMGESIPAAARDYLKSLALSDGGWEWSSGWTADTNTTALAIQALIAAGVDPSDSKILAGLNFLKSAQNADGGFPYDPDSPWGTDSDTNSTAYVLQAIYAVGQDPTSAAWKKDNKTALDFLASVQLSDGSFEWQPTLGSNLLATQQAIPALLGRAAPFASQPLQRCEVRFMPLVNR